MSETRPAIRGLGRESLEDVLPAKLSETRPAIRGLGLAPVYTIHKGAWSETRPAIRGLGQNCRGRNEGVYPVRNPPRD